MQVIILLAMRLTARLTQPQKREAVTSMLRPNIKLFFSLLLQKVLDSGKTSIKGCRWLLRMWHQLHKSTDTTWIVSVVQVSGVVMVQRLFLSTLCSLANHCLNTMANLNIAADLLHPSMVTIYHLKATSSRIMFPNKSHLTLNSRA